MRDTRYQSSYARKQKSSTNIVMWALIVSRLVIFVGIWRVFFRSRPVQPTNLIDNTVTTGDIDKTTYYMGEKILASGVLTPTDDFTTYTHDFRTDQGDMFGLKSKDIDLYTFEGNVQLKGSITDFKGNLPIISVTEIITDGKNNIVDEDIDTNPGYYLFEDQGIGFDLSISQGYSVQPSSDGGLLLMDDENNENIMTISSFACIPGDTLKDCSTLEERFITIGSNNFISANGITFYNLTETSTWAAFHPSGKWGYYITPKDDANFNAFVNLISFVDESMFRVAINDALPTICKNLEYSIEELSSDDEVIFTYEDNGIVRASISQESSDGATLSCDVIIRLGNSIKVTAVDFTSEGGTGLDIEEETTAGDAENEEEEEDDTEEDTQAIQVPLQGVSTLPDNWSESGWFRYQSVRGYDVYFSSKSISYAGEILETPEELVPGVRCIYKINIIEWSRADEIDTNPDLAIYECTGPMTNTDTLQIVGQVDDMVFVSERYTDNLVDMSVVVQGTEEA